GHRVSGLARSDESARKLEERGIRAVRGDITDAGSLREAARGVEAVVHAALMHGEGAEEAERSVVGAVLDVLRGTGRTFVYNSGVWVMGDTPEGVDLADEETRVDPPPMFTWRPAVEDWVLVAAREEAVRTFVVRSGIAYGRFAGGTVGELVDSARERGAARYVVPPEGENNSWALVHLDDLGDFYIRLLEGEAPGGTLLLAVSDGPHRVREIAEAASRAGGAGGRVEAWPLDEALEKLGDHAYALALDQRLSSERVRRLLDWTPSAPSVFEELEDGSYS
ncbi:MAG: NAD(P)H-binding protein, partial [Rubrobacter sp.]|nr:NAD(P)H-binding protein [Rubrobacter sp.]